jgi:hypothetical protein
MGSFSPIPPWHRDAGFAQRSMSGVLLRLLRRILEEIATQSLITRSKGSITDLELMIRP